MVLPDRAALENEHAEVNLVSSEFFAFKILPREFNEPGASTAVSDSDDELNIEAENGETCKAVTERVVRRINEQCKRLGVGLGEGFLINEDIVRSMTFSSPTRLWLKRRIVWRKHNSPQHYFPGWTTLSSGFYGYEI